MRPIGPHGYDPDSHVWGNSCTLCGERPGHALHQPAARRIVTVAEMERDITPANAARFLALHAEFRCLLGPGEPASAADLAFLYAVGAVARRARGGDAGE